MNSMCISIKGNIKCGGKTTDVAKPQKTAKTKLDNNDDDNGQQRNPHIANRYQELGIGEPSRNVVEMIVRASCSNPKRRKKIRRVVKVKNSEEVVAKFERYRREVMSWRSSKEHSRSIVDGNEVLQFYGTTMSCCSSRNRVLSKLCTDSGCRACRVIQSGFDTYYNKLHGIRVSSKSNCVSEDGAVNGAAKGSKRAVIICRTIAAGGGGGGGGGDDMHMVVPNPAALLPCFLVIFD